MSSEKIVKLCSKIINNCDDVPEVFMDGFKYSCLSCNDFPYSVFVARNEDDEEKCSKLITVTQDGLFIFERFNSRVRLTQYDYDNVILIKKVELLVSSILFIKGIINGRLFESKIEFDNNDKNIFDFLIVSMRLKGILSVDFEQEHEKKYEEGNYELLKLGYFKDSNLRLYNYSAESLLHNQIIKKTVLQKKLVDIKFKFIKKVITTSHIVILTNDELIVIQEGKSRTKVPDANIGGSWYFIPISQIECMDIKANDNYLLNFTIKLKRDEDIELIFENCNRSQLEQLVRSSLSVYQQVSDGDSI